MMTTEDEGDQKTEELVCASLCVLKSRDEWLMENVQPSSYIMYIVRAVYYIIVIILRLKRDVYAMQFLYKGGRYLKSGGKVNLVPYTIIYNIFYLDICIEMNNIK